MRRPTGIGRKTVVFLLVLISGLLVLLVGAAEMGAADVGPLLVVVAHPDDEALTMSGVIASARAAGRRVYVAVVTNGDYVVSGSETGYCGAAAGNPATTAKLGLRRESETVAGMGLLGLVRTQDPSTSDIFFFGYPNLQMSAIAAGSGSDNTGLGHTYGEDGDGLTSTCNGDFRYQLSGHHSSLTATSLKADLDSLLALTRPTDVYTLSEIDQAGLGRRAAQRPGSDHARGADLARGRAVPRLHDRRVAEPLAGLGRRRSAGALHPWTFTDRAALPALCERDRHQLGLVGRSRRGRSNAGGDAGPERGHEPEVEGDRQLRQPASLRGRRRRHLRHDPRLGQERGALLAGALRGAACPGPAHRQLLPERPRLDLGDERLGAG
jgi:LmbE family N-acetylglucosaminyl deacetylase